MILSQNDRSHLSNSHRTWNSIPRDMTYYFQQDNEQCESQGDVVDIFTDPVRLSSQPGCLFKRNSALLLQTTSRDITTTISNTDYINVELSTQMRS